MKSTRFSKWAADSMKIRISGLSILAICMPALLSGCANMQFVKETTGKPYAQMVAVESASKTAKHGLKEYACYSCDGKPARTYTNKAGNTVAVYLYKYGADTSHYGVCDLLEHRYEIRNNTVIRAWEVRDGFVSSDRMICPDYNAITDTAGDGH